MSIDISPVFCEFAGMETALIIFAILGAIVIGVLHHWHVIVAYRAECEVARAKQLQVEAMQARVRAEFKAYEALCRQIEPSASQP